MDEAARDTRIVLWTAAGLLACSVSAALLIGNIGFQGDDWWQFSWPYWYTFPYSIWEYIKESRRPIEGLYTVLAFEIFGLNRILYTLSSLFLSAGSALVMGTCLKKAFPGRNSIVVLSALFAFVLPPISNLTYMFHTDNSRLSVLLFWVSVWAFQRWARVSGSWHWLIFPVSLYCMATLTYENTTFLIFSVPLFVWPVQSHCPNGLTDRSFMLRLCTGILAGFAIFVMIRFAVFSGGAVGHSSLMPPAGLVWDYVANLARYCLAPFWDISQDKLAWAWGALVAVICSALLFRAKSNDSSSDQCLAGRGQSSLYMAALGLAVVALGILPYLLAGYDSSMGFTSQSRIYSSASYGVAILLGVLATSAGETSLCNPAGRGTPVPSSKDSMSLRVCRLRLQTGLKFAAVVVITLMAVFFMDLRNKWQEAAEKRNQLCASLLEQVPDVAPGTTFLFLDLQWYLSNSATDRAVVFQGVDGLGEFVRMLYNNKDLYAYFFYPDEKVTGDKEARTASASPTGLVARGSAIRPPIPLDTLLIFMRKGSKLVLLDTLSAKDHLAAINWNGVTALHSNRKLILPASGPNTRLSTMCPP